MAIETDTAMRKIKEIFERSGKSLQQFGEGMGYEKEVARKGAWQFLNSTNDPRLSMLRKFADAIGVSVRDIV